VHEYGGPDVLRVEEVEDPHPGPGEVVVRMAATGLNHFDVDAREGTARMPTVLPHTLGIETVGTIAELGPGVDDWSIGDRVAPHLIVTCGKCRYCRSGRETLCVAAGYMSWDAGGCYAELVRCRARQLIRLPDELSDVDAAAVQLSFGASWHMLFSRAHLSFGETVMISSVASGLGSAAAQLAKLAGARVIGLASSNEKLQRASDLGVDVGINYVTSDPVQQIMEETEGYGVDVVFEHVGGPLFATALSCLARDGRLVTCGAHAGEVVALDLVPLFRAQQSIIGSLTFSRAEAEASFNLAARGDVRPVIHGVFPLSEAAEAMRVLEDRNHVGKVVLVNDVH
jgi:NADPH:quinone reductase-like Zn-dependent oxidoreductase